MAITSDAGSAARTWRARSAHSLAVLSGAVGLGNLGLAVLAVIEGSAAWQIAVRVGAAAVFGLLAWTVIRACTRADSAGIRTTSGPWIAWSDVVDVRSSRSHRPRRRGDEGRSVPPPHRRPGERPARRPRPLA